MKQHLLMPLIAIFVLTVKTASAQHLLSGGAFPSKKEIDSAFHNNIAYRNLSDNLDSFKKYYIKLQGILEKDTSGVYDEIFTSSIDTKTKRQLRKHLDDIQQLFPDTVSLSGMNYLVNSAIEYDSIALQLHDLYHIARADAAAGLLNSRNRFTLITSAGVSNLETVSSLGGNISIGGLFRLTNYSTMRRPGWIDPLFMYIMFDGRTHRSDDSIRIAKTFLFPEIGRRDLVVGLYHSFEQTIGDVHRSIRPTFEISLNKVAKNDDSSFRTESFVLGLRYSQEEEISNQNIIGFSVMPYYNIINIDPKHHQMYNYILLDSLDEQQKADLGKIGLPATYHNIGIQLILRVNNLQLFANAKYVLNSLNNLTNVNTDPPRYIYDMDLKSINYVLGIVYTLDINRFDLFN